MFKARALEGKHNSPTPPYGYLRDPGDKEKWIVDEDAAVVVRRIYQMVLNGMGPYQIAQALSDEKVPIPSYHWQKLGVGNRKNQVLPYPYTWGASVIRCILEKEEYMGHTVTMKTFTHSYKDKKRKLTPKDQRLIFENTHEAIIDPDTWNTVQRLSRTVRRPTRYGPPNRLTGLLYCADCGKKMTNERTMVSTKKNEPRNNYGCSTFRYRGHHCTMHFIRAAAAEELILHTIRTVSTFVRENEEEFVRRVRDLSDARREESMKERRTQLAKSERRCAELDTLIRKIYEDKVSGSLSEKRFAILSGEYEREQDALETAIAEAQAELDAWDAQGARADKFVELVRRHTDFTELTTPMLNEFVEKVMVHAPDKSSGKRVQRVDIYLSFIGKFELPEGYGDPSPEELAAQEKLDAHRAKRREIDRNYRAKKKQKLLEEQRRAEVEQSA